jgi:SNF2 family DNA or RNA helicase
VTNAIKTSGQTNTCLILEEQLTKTTPFRHQAEITEVSKDHRYFGYFMEQGTGKSHVTIAVMTYLYREGRIDGVLILAPNGVHDNWVKNEIPIHCPLTEHQMQVACWHGTDGKKKRGLWDYIANESEAPLVILAANIEAVRTTAFMASIKGFISKRRFLLVIDESTTIKNPKAEQSKAVHRIAKNAAYSRILTGTPITQSPLDLWSQCRALDEAALPYPSFTAFKHEFAIEQVLNFGHRTFTKVVGYQNQEKLKALIAPFTRRVLKKDCLDLPEKIYQVRYVELTAEQKRIYKDLTKQCLAALPNDGMVTVTAAITMMLRLHQVALGYVESDEGKLVHIEHNRIASLISHLEENDSKAIIFCRFLEDVHQVVQALGDRFKPDIGPIVRYTGDESSQLRGDAVHLFQNDPTCRFFVATSAASKGLTLTAEQVIYYSQGFSLETRLQSEDRPHRIGQTKNVLYTDLVAQGTIDERVISALKQKKTLADSVLTPSQLSSLLQLEE